jgi:hypothetical protein
MIEGVRRKQTHEASDTGEKEYEKGDIPGSEWGGGGGSQKEGMKRKGGGKWK